MTMKNSVIWAVTPCDSCENRFFGRTYRFKSIILPVVLYGCEIWSLTLREGHRLRMFENRALKRMHQEGCSDGRVEKTA
jgi:hypothetical protein